MSPGEDPPDARNRKITGAADRNYRPASSVASGTAISTAIREALAQAQQVSAELQRYVERLTAAANRLAAKSGGGANSQSREVTANLRDAAGAVKKAQTHIRLARNSTARSPQRPPTGGGAAGR